MPTFTEHDRSLPDRRQATEGRPAALGPRDGRNIHASQLISALREGLHLSLPLSLFLTFGSYLLLGQFRHLSLADLARHGAIEHDVSLAHTDAHASAEYAPCRIDKKALAALLRDSADGRVLTARDVAHARVRRESRLRVPLDHVHAEIARGEMALVLGVFGQRAGAGGGAAETEAPPKDKVACELVEQGTVPEELAADAGAGSASDRACGCRYQEGHGGAEGDGRGAKGPVNQDDWRQRWCGKKRVLLSILKMGTICNILTEACTAIFGRWQQTWFE
ncbi:hypothetical protein HETIRDRAFT_449299 [Heterobasidion irregulare TC 32-1]|uniref:Heme haloperoxidase family profile domain-containing protein n=1 Tax=Heterobasidion irregulare (strain TC 32-1) TaxID=747525 RepID=W4KE62_HETIT|nr:uncharacterized protein HETIRDRAFT_449299 [Heterobasidion irregulare TC 32-1]ETW83610.1 hypothetical protein HETIRDRAFT_449299 [Heterobasidion irregulare TC 32-1]